jgi:hypothetical protein
MATYLSGNSRWYLFLNISVSGSTPASNFSTITWSVSVDKNLSGFDGSATGALSWSGTSPNGVGFSGSRTYGSSERAVTLESGSFNLSHNSTTGAASATLTGKTSGDIGPNSTIYYAPSDTSMGSQGVVVTTFSGPSQPGTPSITRTGTGGTIGVTSQTPAANTLAITKYQYRWSYDNATWNQPADSGSSAYDMAGTSASFSATSTSVAYVQTRAISTTSYGWGTGAWSTSAVAYAAPSITSATSVGTTATVGLAAPASDGNSTINATTGYAIDYSTDSAFGTFLTKSSAGVGSNSITGLLPGNTYYFRAKYVNSASVTSPYSASALTFIAAYGRRYATASITAATAGATTTYTSNGHYFGVGDTVTIAGVSPSNFDTSGAVTAVTANTFTIALNTTGQTYASGGTAVGWVRMLTGQRYAADAGSGSPGWVPITTAQKYSGAWSSFNN